MAQFNLNSVGDISLVNDFPKLQSYLYQLQRQLRYMFDNLTPEDNYSSEAYEKYLSDGENASSIKQSVDLISLEMLTADNVVAAINLNREGVKIQGDRIQMEGVVTVNSYFKIGMDGSIEAVNGRFSGDIEASNIYGSTITAGGTYDGEIIIKNSAGTEIGRWDKNGISVKQGVINLLWGSNAGVYADGSRFQAGNWVVSNVNGRNVFQSDDEVTGLSGSLANDKQLYMWAGWDNGDFVFAVNAGDAYVTYNGHTYPIGQSIDNLNSAVDVSSGGNEGPDVYDEEDEAVIGGLIFEDGWVISPGV